MRFVRRSNNPNLFVGLILLLLLAVFAGPSTLPRLLSNINPQFYAGVPCSWLRTAEDRAFHQSLLGRAATNPFSLTRADDRAARPMPAAACSSTSSSPTIRSAPCPFVYDPAARDRRRQRHQRPRPDLHAAELAECRSAAPGQRHRSGNQSAPARPAPELRRHGRIPGGQRAGRSQPHVRQATGARLLPQQQNGQIIQPSRDRWRRRSTRDQGLWTGYVESANATIPLASQ